MAEWRWWERGETRDWCPGGPDRKASLSPMPREVWCPGERQDLALARVAQREQNMSAGRREQPRARANLRRSYNLEFLGNRGLLDLFEGKKDRPLVEQVGEQASPELERGQNS